jgi:hypothetical protein
LLHYPRQRLSRSSSWLRGPSGAPKAIKASLTPRHRDVRQTVELLCYWHGEAKARKLAGREQRRARQARSRKQFAFWAAVAVELEKQLRAGIGQDELV